MPFSLHGIGVSRGYAIGRTYLLQRNQPEITEYTIPDAIIEDEVQRFLNSLEIARRQLRDVRVQVPPTAPTEVAAFIDTHLLMLEDATFTEAPIKLIRTRKCNAEWALKIQRICWSRYSRTWTTRICAPARTMWSMWCGGCSVCW